MHDLYATCREIWVEAPDSSGLLCALIHGNVGWLMYLREPGDAGFSSRNIDYIGDPNANITYRLSNGQVDEYPAHWALEIDVVERAIEHFRTTGEQPPFVVWHDDSL